MKIVIYTEEKGLHNPFLPNNEIPYTLANFLILSIQKIELLLGVKASDIFSRSRNEVVTDVKGALMSFMFKNEAFKKHFQLSSVTIGNLFKRRHYAVLYYADDKKNKSTDKQYQYLKTEIWKLCEVIILEKETWNDIDRKMFFYKDMEEFAVFLGKTKKELDAFLTMRA